MAARAIWKGVITFGDVRVPVKLYSAAQDRTVHFNLLHDQDMVRIRQRMVNASTGEEVELSRAKKGVQVEPGRYVLISPEELAGLEPPEGRDITVEKFLEAGTVGHAWYERPYYLGPDEGGAAPYWVLAQSLEESGREGLARWVMRKREYVGLLRAERGYLMLITARRADEVVPASEIEPPTGRKADPKELAMARQLVEALEDRFDPAEYRDEYRDRVLELIEKKARGEEIEIRRPERKAPARSLASALKASIEAARKEKARA